MAVFPGEHSTIPVPELENWNLDRTVEPLTMVRGGMHKTSAGWQYDNGRSSVYTSTGTEVFTKFADGKPRVANTPYGYDVSEGNITDHSA